MLLKKNKIPKLTLVGAGPGDPDLITLKGIKAIKNADVILYDALIAEELLDFAPKQTLKIYVGKRGGTNYIAQEDIHKLIVDKAFEYGHVVRLKGGDPMVFGRGHEELDYAKAFGLETAIVPGISSAISVPEMQEIPVTKRGVSESFWVLTATTQDGRLSKDLHLAAQSKATVIVLMGVHKIKQIVSLYAGLNKHNLPIAVIQNGTCKNEKIAISTIENIEEVIIEQNIQSPAIIVIGDVVLEHPSVLEKITNEQVMKNLA
jgi:uroporphyrin-III C-methyltransferase